MLTFTVGLDAAGKTTILYKLKLGEVVSTIPTIGKLLIVFNFFSWFDGWVGNSVTEWVLCWFDVKCFLSYNPTQVKANELLVSLTKFKYNKNIKFQN